MIAFLFVWNILTVAVCVWLVRKALAKGKESRTWKAQQRTVRAEYTQSKRTFDGITYYVSRRGQEVKIEPPGDSFCLDPSKSDFTEKLSEYRAAAKAVAISLNNDERLNNE